MGQLDDDTPQFGLPDLIAAVLAVGLAVLAAPAAAAPPDEDDWNFLWVKPTDSLTSGEGVPISMTGTTNLALQPLASPYEASRDPVTFVETASTSSFARRIEFMPVGARFAPPVDGNTGFQPGVTLREDNWTMLEMQGLVRLSAYARGTLAQEDAALARTPMPFPRGMGTGFGVVTATPVYVGATVKTDRSIYDIDFNRFDGARWSTSVFMGTDTSFGPLYLGTTKDANGARSAYLYLGRWF